MLKPKADNCEYPMPLECFSLPQIYSFALSHNLSLSSVALRAKRNLSGKSLGAFQIELNDLPTLRQKLQLLADKKYVGHLLSTVTPQWLLRASKWFTNGLFLWNSENI